MTDARTVTHRVPSLVLRAGWWSAVTLLGLHLIIWPGLLDHPSTPVGSANIRWIPMALLIWILVGGRWVASSRPVQVVRGLARGLTVMIFVIVAIAVALLLTKFMAALVGALIG